MHKVDAHPKGERASKASTLRLVSWKAIAEYFDCTERTAKRWERERGLPIYRAPGGRRGYVFAYAQELDEWLRDTRAQNPDIKAGQKKLSPEAHIFPGAEEQALTHSGTRSQPRRYLFGVVACTAILVGGTVILWNASLRGTTNAPLASKAHANPGGSSTQSHHVPGPGAAELYLRGRYYWSLRTDESLSKALDAYTQAIIKDPAYAEPYAGLAETYDLLPQFGRAKLEDAMLRARNAADKAIELNPNLASAHRAKAFEMFFWDWDIPGSDAEFRLAISLDPGAAETHHWYASTLINRLEGAKAIREIDAALSLNPTSPAIVIDAAFVHASFDADPQSWTQKLLDLGRTQPTLLTPNVFLRDMYFGAGNFPAYLTELKRIASITHNPDDLKIADSCARGWASGGKLGLLQAKLKALLVAFHKGTESGYYLGQTYLLLGRSDDALPFFQASLKQRYILLIVMEQCNYAKGLASQPGYAALFTQIHERMHNAQLPHVKEVPIDFELPR